MMTVAGNKPDLTGGVYPADPKHPERLSGDIAEWGL
jgi:hypothetical protein